MTSGAQHIIGWMAAALFASCAPRTPEQRSASEPPGAQAKAERATAATEATSFERDSSSNEPSGKPPSGKPKEPEPPPRRPPCRLVHCSSQVAVVVAAPREESQFDLQACHAGVCMEFALTVPAYSYQGRSSRYLEPRALLVEDQCARYAGKGDPCQQGNLPQVLRASAAKRHVVVFVEVAFPQESQVLDVRARFQVAGKKAAVQVGRIAFDENTLENDGRCHSPNGQGCEPRCCVWAVALAGRTTGLCPYDRTQASNLPV